MNAVLRGGPLLRALGWPGMAGIGVLVACASACWSAWLPLAGRLEAAQARQQELARASVRPAGQAQLPAQLEAFYRRFPARRELPAELEKIFAAAAAQGISLDKAEYRSSRAVSGRLNRIQITLPVSGEYPKIRLFLATVRQTVPTAAIAAVTLARKGIADPAVEAQIRLLLFVEAGR